MIAVYIVVHNNFIHIRDAVRTITVRTAADLIDHLPHCVQCDVSEILDRCAVAVLDRTGISRYLVSVPALEIIAGSVELVRRQSYIFAVIVGLIRHRSGYRTVSVEGYGVGKRSPLRLEAYVGSRHGEGVSGDRERGRRYGLPAVKLKVWTGRVGQSDRVAHFRAYRVGGCIGAAFKLIADDVGLGIPDSLESDSAARCKVLYGCAVEVIYLAVVIRIPALEVIAVLLKGVRREIYGRIVCDAGHFRHRAVCRAVAVKCDGVSIRGPCRLYDLDRSRRICRRLCGSRQRVASLSRGRPCRGSRIECRTRCAAPCCKGIAACILTAVEIIVDSRIGVLCELCGEHNCVRRVARYYKARDVGGLDESCGFAANRDCPHVVELIARGGLDCRIDSTDRSVGLDCLRSLSYRTHRRALGRERDVIVVRSPLCDIDVHLARSRVSGAVKDRRELSRRLLHAVEQCAVELIADRRGRRGKRS